MKYNTNATTDLQLHRAVDNKINCELINYPKLGYQENRQKGGKHYETNL